MNIPRRLGALAAIGLASLSFAGPAWAFHFLPAAAKFTGTGSATLSGAGSGFPCQARYTFKTNDTGSKAKITKMQFFGSPHDCVLIDAVGLPWTMVPTSSSTANILAVNITTPGPNCGPGTFPITVSGGSISFNAPLNPGNCQFSGTIASSPQIFIGP